MCVSDFDAEVARTYVIKQIEDGVSQVALNNSTAPEAVCIAGLERYIGMVVSGRIIPHFLEQKWSSIAVIPFEDEGSIPPLISEFYEAKVDIASAAGRLKNWLNLADFSEFTNFVANGGYLRSPGHLLTPEEVKEVQNYRYQDLLSGIGMYTISRNHVVFKFSSDWAILHPIGSQRYLRPRVASVVNLFMNRVINDQGQLPVIEGVPVLRVSASTLATVLVSDYQRKLISGDSD